MDAGCCFVKSESSSASLSLLFIIVLFFLSLFSPTLRPASIAASILTPCHSVSTCFLNPLTFFSLSHHQDCITRSLAAAAFSFALSLSSSRLSLPLSPSFLVSVLSGVKPTFSQRDSVVPASAAVQGRRQRELESSRGSSRRAAVVVVKKRRSVGEKREREARVGQQKCTRVCVHHVNWLPDWMMQASCSGLSGAAPVQLQIQRDRTDKRVNERV